MRKFVLDEIDREEFEVIKAECESTVRALEVKGFELYTETTNISETVVNVIELLKNLEKTLKKPILLKRGKLLMDFILRNSSLMGRFFELLN